MDYKNSVHPLDLSSAQNLKLSGSLSSHNGHVRGCVQLKYRATCPSHECWSTHANCQVALPIMIATFCSLSKQWYCILILIVGLKASNIISTVHDHLELHAGNHCSTFLELCRR